MVSVSTRRVLVLLLLAGLAGPAGRAAAYPERPVELTVPFAPGGGSDIMARAIAAIVEQERLLPRPLVVVNRPGANGILGYLHVGLRAGDPYVLSVATPSFVIQPLLGHMKLTYRDFAPIAGLVLDEFVLVTPAASPHQSLGDLLAAARLRPRHVIVGGSSAPSSDSIITHLVERAAGVQFKFVPFRSGGEVIAQLLGGHIDVASANPGEALAQLQAGRVRALAIASDRRLASLPHVPTLRESGVDVVVTQWRGVVAPRGIPPDAETVLVTAFRRLTESPAWARYLREHDLTPLYLAPEAFARHLEAEAERLARVLRDMGVIP